MATAYQITTTSIRRTPFSINTDNCNACWVNMATSSASSISSTPVPKPSRFSSFKGFKLSREKSLKPPPPPPKDPYYLKNRSLASLSPDSLFIPPHSPLSPNTQYLRRPSPDMNQSTMSLVSSPPSCLPDDPPRLRDKKSAFFRLKRSPKSPLSKKSPSPDALPPPPTEDENISMPWNFQVRDIYTFIISP